MALTQTQVSQLYVSVFGRASEGDGNAYWQNDAASTSLAAAANIMLDTQPAKDYFGATMDDDAAFIAHIYLNTLGKTYDEEPAGQDYWVSELAAGKSKGEVVAALITAAQDPVNAGAAQDQFNNKVLVSNHTADTIAAFTNISDFTAFISGVDDTAASVTAANAAVDMAALQVTGSDFTVTPGTAGTADVMGLTGKMDVRIDFTNPANQVKGLDLNGDNTIANDGVENVITGKAANFEIVDAYARNPLNELDTTHNFLGDIAFDGTGFGGDGVTTDGNIVLGGLGADTIFGGIGNDFLTGGGIATARVAEARAAWIAAGGTIANFVAPSDNLSGGRNADFFFVELSALDATDGNRVNIDGGNTADDSAAGNVQTAQDADWLLFEASDDDEPVSITLGEDSPGAIQAGSITSRSGQTLGVLRDVENFDASGNLYGFLDSVNVELGGRRMDDREVQNGTLNNGIGSSAQLNVVGSNVGNIIIGGYDNDSINGNGGNDLLMGGNLANLINPNLLTIENDGRDTITGGLGDDNIVFEADGGQIEGDATAGVIGAGNDTLWLTNLALGTKTAADMTTDGFIRLDLDSQNIDTASGYGGADFGTRNATADDTQDQTNYKTGVARTTVQDMDNVIATGLGAVDYDTDGTNTGDIAHLSQVNQLGYAGNLTLRGTAGANTLYANTGTDVIEGRQGGTYTTDGAGQVLVDANNAPVGDARDKLSGGVGDDDFVFSMQNSQVVGIAGDGVDVIHRQADLDGDNLWDGHVASTNLGGDFVQDFGVSATTSTADSKLTLTLTDSAHPTDLTGFPVNGVKFSLDGVDYTVSLATGVQSTYAAFNDGLNAALDADPALAGLNSVLNADNTMTITDPAGKTFVSIGYSFIDNVVPPAGTLTWDQIVGGPAVSKTQDRLIYRSYEDRADGEAVDDNAVTGSSISLGTDAYAEDLVVDFSADGTRIAEDQLYTLNFDNLTTEDTVAISVNGVNYKLTVGVDLDGNAIAGEELTTQGGAAATQAAIQTAFLARMAAFINTFMDNDTAAGQVNATATATSLLLNQVDYNAEETVFMRTPLVTLTNGSTGEVATVNVVNNSQHEVQLLDFDGRNGELNAGNVLFVGNTEVNRSNLVTALNAGETLAGTEAVVIDGGVDNLEATVRTTGAAIANNTATNSLLATDFTVHGDDFLIGGTGSDTITGGTGDDRVLGSLGTDTIDGGKSYYAVQVLGEAQARVYVMNQWEASNPAQVTALSGLTVTSVNRIADSENDGTGFAVGTGTNEVYNDTLQFQQNDFTPGASRFTVSLDNFTTTAGVVELRNGGAGKVGVDNDGDGTIDTTTTFTNFENIRTVSGTGNAVAGDGQGNDTLDVTALSAATGGISYDLTNAGTAGDVAYGKDASINAKAYALGQKAALVTGATVASVKAAIVTAQETVAFQAAVNAIPVFATTTIASFLNSVAALADLTRPTSATDTLTLAPLNTADYETQVIKVDGVESVIAGTGNDLLLIDETEAAKNNSFAAGTGVDRIEYQNSYVGGADLEPTVTIKVAGLGTSTVEMTGGRVGTTLATDTLTGVEYVTLAGNTGQARSEADTMDVSALTAGAVVNYVDGTVKTGGVTQQTIENLFQVEKVVGSAGADTVTVADAAIMDNNARTDLATADVNIALESYLNYDKINTDLLTDRLSLVQLSSGIKDKATASAALPQVLNTNQFKFDLGAGNDTMNYSLETGRIASVVFPISATGVQSILVDGNNAAPALPIDLSDSTEDRIDQITGVENVVASIGGGVLDLTGATVNTRISFSNNYDPAANWSTTGFTGYGLETHQIKVADATTGTSLISTNYLDYVYVDANPLVADAIPASARWTSVEGSDLNETVDLSGWEAGAVNTLNLRGGSNRVNYEGDSVALTINVIAPVEANPAGTGLISINALHTAPSDDHNAATLIDPAVSATDVITSYSAQNAIKAGDLTIKGARGALDTVTFAGGLDSKVLVMGGVVDATSAITVRIGSTAKGNLNSLQLVGFETLNDASTNDAYDMTNFANVLTNITLADNAANDHDSILLRGGEGVVAGVIDLDVFAGAVVPGTNGLAMDFDVLDIVKTTSTGLTVDGRVAVDTGAPAPLLNQDELVVGALNKITTITNFESLVLTKDSIVGGATFSLNTITDTLTQGSTSLTYNGNALSAGGTVFEGTLGDSYIDTYIDPSTGLNDRALTGGVTINLTSAAADAVTLVGSNFADALNGGAGNDTLIGFGGNDTITAGLTAEVRQFNLTGTPAAAAANRLAFDFMGAGHILVSEAAVATTGFTAVAGVVTVTVLDGAGNDAIGAALAGAMNANLAIVNADWLANGGDAGSSITSVTYNTSTDQLNFTFNGGQNIATAINLGYAANGDAGTFAVSAETTSTEGSDGGLNVIRGGAGVDNMTGGANNDTFVVVGSVSAAQATAYKANLALDTQGEIDAITGGNVPGVVQLSELQTAHTTSDAAAGETYAGGSGTDTLVTFGDVDFTGSTLNGIEVVNAYSSVTLTEAQARTLTSINFNGDGPHTLVVNNSAGVALTAAQILALPVAVTSAGGTAAAAFTIGGTPYTAATFAAANFNAGLAGAVTMTAAQFGALTDGQIAASGAVQLTIAPENAATVTQAKALAMNGKGWTSADASDIITVSDVLVNTGAEAVALNAIAMVDKINITSGGTLALSDANLSTVAAKLDSDGSVNVTSANGTGLAGITWAGAGANDTITITLTGAGALALPTTLTGFASTTISGVNAAAAQFSGLNSTTAAIAAGTLTDGNLLTLAGSANTTVTGLLGDITSTMTGTLSVTTGAHAATAGSTITSATATTVDASGQAANSNLTVAGAGNFGITGLAGDLTASALTGTLTAVLSDQTVDDIIDVVTGSGATSLTTTAGTATDTVNIDATALAQNTALTLNPGASAAGSIVNVTTFVGDLVATNHASGGAITVTTGDAVDNGISLTTGATAFNANVNAGSATDTVAIVATALANDTALTINAAGSAAAGTVNVTGLAGNLVLTNASSGTIGVTVVDNTVDNDIAITAGASNLTVTGAAAGDTINVTAFTGTTFVGNSTTTGLYNVAAGAGDQSITTGNGADIITGGAGKDTMTGGAGNDSYVYAAGATDTLAAAASVAGVDVIVGLDLGTAVVGGQVDTLNLNETVAAVNTTVTGSVAAGTFIANMATLLAVAGGAGFDTDAAGDISAALVVVNAGDLSGKTYLAVDSNNDDNFTAADMVIEVTGVSGTLDISDFI